MRVALTGVGSAVGRAAVRALSAHDCVLFDATEERRPGVVSHDLIFPERYGPELAGVQVLIHMADRWGDEPALYHHNLKGTQALLHAFSAHGSPELLVILSTALLGDADPTDPDAPPGRFGSAWLATRSAVEARAVLWARSLGVETLIVRAGHPIESPSGPLESLLERALGAASSGGELSLRGAHLPLPFVRSADLAAALAARVDGDPWPGAQRATGPVSLGWAVSTLCSLAELYSARCLTEGHEATVSDPGKKLRSRVLDRMLPRESTAAPPAFLRRAAVSALEPAWQERFGEAPLSELLAGL